MIIPPTIEKLTAAWERGEAMAELECPESPPPLTIEEEEALELSDDD